MRYTFVMSRQEQDRQMAIDLRSDFVARPTAKMVEAMAEAANRPTGFGLREDQTVARLERLAAETLGKADALYVPTCTMANQIAIHLHCRPGENFLTEADAHVVTSEAAALVPDDAQRARIAMVLQENTHVCSGGRVLTYEQMAAITELARARAVPVHLDGSRIFNAAIALARPASDLAALADSISFSLNKGLGAPLGAILAGPKALIAEAVRVQQMFGGGWRPAGIPAAAGIVALETMIDRLEEDPRHARQLADGLAAITGPAFDAPAESNIVLVRPTVMEVEPLAAALAEQDILALPFGRCLRLVTHHEVTATVVAKTLAAFRAVLAGGDNSA